MGLFPTVFGSIILILFSYIVFTPKAANVTVSVSPDFKMKHIRQGNCKKNPGVYVHGNNIELVNGSKGDIVNYYESFGNNFNRTAQTFKDFKRNKLMNTFIMTESTTDDDISECIKWITWDKNGQWQQGKISSNKKFFNLFIKKEDFTSCLRIKTNPMYLAILEKIKWTEFPKHLKFNCTCYSDEFNIEISLEEVTNNNETEYIINHYAGQTVYGKGTVCG